MPARSTEERVLGGAAHLSCLLGAPGFLIAFVIYVWQRGRSYFVAHNARQAIGFQLAVFLARMLLSILGVGSWGMMHGLSLAGAVTMAAWVLAAVAAVHAFLGRFYRYPVIGDWIPDE